MSEIVGLGLEIGGMFANDLAEDITIRYSQTFPKPGNTRAKHGELPIYLRFPDMPSEAAARVIINYTMRVDRETDSIIHKVIFEEDLQNADLDFHDLTVEFEAEELGIWAQDTPHQSEFIKYKVKGRWDPFGIGDYQIFGRLVLWARSNLIDWMISSQHSMVLARPPS